MLQLLLSPAGKAVGGLLAAGALYAGGYVHGRLDGRQLAERAIIADIVEKNERAGHDAEQCRERYRACVDAGGLFDFADCACQR